MCYSSLVEAFLDHKLPVPLQKVYGVVLKPTDRTVRMWSLKFGPFCTNGRKILVQYSLVIS